MCFNEFKFNDFKFKQPHVANGTATLDGTVLEGSLQTGHCPAPLCAVVIRDGEGLANDCSPSAMHNAGLELTMVLLTTWPRSLEAGHMEMSWLLSNTDPSQSLDSSHDSYVASDLYGNQSSRKK